MAISPLIWKCGQGPQLVDLSPICVHFAVNQHLTFWEKYTVIYRGYFEKWDQFWVYLCVCVNFNMCLNCYIKNTSCGACVSD